MDAASAKGLETRNVIGHMQSREQAVGRSYADRFQNPNEKYWLRHFSCGSYNEYHKRR
jgi:hypothetical protein